jgi:hypothetical protein
MNATVRGNEDDDRKPRDLARFAAVDAWVFDLDNTLYPALTSPSSSRSTRASAPMSAVS